MVDNMLGDAPGISHDRQRGVGSGRGGERPAVNGEQISDLVRLAPLVQY